MPKRRVSSRGKVGATPSRVDELARRLAALEQYQHELEAEQRALGGLRVELEQVRQLALEAAAQAQDAHATSSLARAHEDRLNNLTLAVAEGIQHVERAEYRIRATIQRARRELAESGAESAGLEAEARDLREVDGGRGLESGVPPVSTPVAEPPAEDPLMSSLRALRLSR